MSAPLTAFIEESYNDTLSLMTELRDYLAEIQEDPDQPDVVSGPVAAGPEIRTVIIREISSMTRNLTEAMAWLLLQKAAAAGEITPDEAATRANGLLTGPDTAPPPKPDVAALPIEVRGYIDRCRRLYEQIHRLRDMAGNQPI